MPEFVFACVWVTKTFGFEGVGSCWCVLSVSAQCCESLVAHQRLKGMSQHVHLLTWLFITSRTILNPTFAVLTVPMVTHIFGTPLSRLLRMMSDGWMMRSGRSSQTSPMDELLPLLYFPPPLNPPPPPLILPLSGPQLPLPPLDGLCATWAPLLHRLESLQLDQPDPNPIPQATLLVCRYTQSRITRGLQASLFLGNIDVCLYFSLVPGPDQQSKNTVSKTSSSASGRVRTKSWKFLKCVILPSLFWRFRICFRKKRGWFSISSDE